MSAWRCSLPRIPVMIAAALAGISGSEAFAQPTEEWVARFDGAASAEDRATAIAVDAFGNTHITGGSASGATGLDFVTVKYDAAGNVAWSRAYDGPGKAEDVANAIAVDASSNVYVTGRSMGSAGAEEDYATIKYDGAGNVQWIARYNGPADNWDEALAIAVDTDGYVYVTGRSNRTGIWFDFDYLTIKYSPTGGQEWVARFNGPGNDWDQARAIALDDDGNVYVTGTMSVDVGTAYHNYATIKYDAAGVQQWVSGYNGTGNNWDEAVAIALDGSGSVFVTGYSSGLNAGWDIATLRITPDGSFDGAMVYDGPGGGISHDVATGLKVDAAGNAYVTGSSALDYVTVKYDPEGTEEWAARYASAGGQDDIPSAIALDGSGGVVVTGASAQDFVTLKCSESGQQLWIARHAAPGEDAASALAVDAAGCVYVTGYGTDAGTGNDYRTIKYLPVGPAGTEEGAGVPELALRNHPNPFQSTTTFEFFVPTDSDRFVSLRIVDLTGRVLETLAQGEMPPGVHRVTWNADQFRSGTYGYVLRSGGIARSGRTVLIR